MKTECEDPRDKAYAVRGLTEGLMVHEVVPDYKKSIKEVYSDVVRFVLEQEGPFGFLDRSRQSLHPSF